MKYEITTKKYVLTESGTTLIIPISFFDDVIRTELPEQFLAAEKETLRLLSAELPSEEKIKAAVREFLRTHPGRDINLTVSFISTALSVHRGP